MALAVCLSGCGNAGASEQSKRDIARLKQQIAKERQAATALRKQINQLKQQVAKLKVALKPYKQRAGLVPFRGGVISSASGAQLERVKGTRVATAGDRGKKAALSKTIAAGRGAVIGFWATWCKPCIANAELHHMKTLQEQLKPYNVAFASVLIDDLGKAQAHPKAEKWIYPLWFIKDGHMNMLPRSLVQRVGLGLPFFLVVDPSGAVKWFHKGKLVDDTVRDLLTAAARL